MPRDGPVTFGDLIGKLNALSVACEKCGRSGRYQLHNLIEERGRDAIVSDWLEALTAHCPKKKAHDWNDQCAVRCLDLPKAF